MTDAMSPTCRSDTIAAIATAAGMGGIGIVRISGPGAIPIAGRLFERSRSKRDGRLDGEPLPSHRLTHGYIRDPDNDIVVDEVLIATMLSPHSYTCEDVVEIQSHGGALILSKILELTLRYGARLAEPGEFTRRAFLNGRIDLSQAEAVTDLISAQNESALALAAFQLRGGLRDKISSLRQKLVGIIADLEALIEFPDEMDGDGLDHEALVAMLDNELVRPIEALVSSFQKGRIFKDGVRIVIAGRPNVGKSSLMNRLIEKEKAIVTPIPGTTRDTVEGTIFIDNQAIHIVDTAGLRESQDPIEIIGMRKTRENVDNADAILVVIEAMCPGIPEDRNILAQIDPEKAILVINKIDLNSDRHPTQLPVDMGKMTHVFVSALEGRGIERLKAIIAGKCLPKVSFQIEETIVFNARQLGALEKALNFMRATKAAICQGLPEELICMDLDQGLSALGEITGERLNDDVLDTIFGKFCIGK